MSMWIARAAGLTLTSTLLATTGAGAEAVDTSGIFVKKAIADTMTAEQLQAYKERLARNFAARRAPLPGIPSPETPGDTCPAASYELATLPWTQADTTLGASDDYDLPPDVTNPTCTAAVTCTGTGPAGSLPRGAIYTGTGTGPDRAWKIKTIINCDLTITLDPTGTEDLALSTYLANCTSSLADCACVSDSGVGGQAETVLLTTLAGTDYFIVVDGYSTGGTPPGPAGPYTLTISGTQPNCIWPVELQRISIE